MPDTKLEKKMISFQNFINDFEKRKIQQKKRNQNTGTAYTPYKVADFIVSNVIKLLLEEIFNEHHFNFKFHFSRHLDILKFKQFIIKHPSLKKKLLFKVKSLKILDPACGSGRFLITTAKMIFKLLKILEFNLSNKEIRRFIIENVIYGVDIEKSACVISKLRLISWLHPDAEIPSLKVSNKLGREMIEDIEHAISKMNLNLNIFNVEFLLKFNPKVKFDLIIGNPPYVENKKISDLRLKRALQNQFKSAFRLFDLSILFIEKSLAISKSNEAIISFLMTNKFLAADYGIKIRKILLNNTELKEIHDVSALPMFVGISSYPVIITFINRKPTVASKFKIFKFTSMTEIFANQKNSTRLVEQEFLKNLPSKVFPISGDLEAMKILYSNHRLISEAIEDLRIIYRPYGFTNWKRFFKNITKKKHSDKDLLLIGTGNVGKYHVNFEKRIRIAKNDLEISFFKFMPEFEEKWELLNGEKLIFREIAKSLTVVYDPGNFTNITGLYFICIPSFTTDQLFGLLTILNSELMNHVFSSLFGTLHMSGNYLRYNGSFIKRLPMPDHVPDTLSYLGKINQFLSQLLCNKGSLNLNWDDIERYKNFFMKISNKFVYLLYFHNQKEDLSLQFNILLKFLNQVLFDLEFGYAFRKHDHCKLHVYSQKELFSILDNIRNSSNSLRKMMSSQDQLVVF
ncbi:MAG: hypothetical protein EU539_00145 [Promethearchaeota archaeon]|nr:MAG: hypothetical protein EU539_00145 [Candidatus Lokiarchaeota archaeon]